MEKFHHLGYHFLMLACEDYFSLELGRFLELLNDWGEFYGFWAGA
jgi:hypothetical protein